MAIIAGKIWHRPDKLGQYLVVIDLDKKKAFEEFCTRNGKTVSLEEMAQQFIVEQHIDDKERCHIYFYSPFSFQQKSPNPMVGIEVKSLGKHGTSFCCPSIHSNKDSQDRKEWRYEILGKPIVPITLTKEQAVEMIQHINCFCAKNSVSYLENEENEGVVDKFRPMIKSLQIDHSIRIDQGERHKILL